MDIADKKVVQLHYKGTLDDGAVFDSSEGRDPLTFIYGSGMIIPGLEEGLKGLKKGDKKSVKVESAKAYGEYMKEGLREVPKDQMPQEVELKAGMQLMAQGPQGPMPVKIEEIKDEVFVVDFNHPLAGKNLTFDVDVVDVRDATKEELEHGHAHGPGGHDHGPEEPEKK